MSVYILLAMMLVAALLLGCAAGCATKKWSVGLLTFAGVALALFSIFIMMSQIEFAVYHILGILMSSINPNSSI